MSELTRDRIPLITVIVVNWNGLEFLDECLDSLERQTWPNREFILVDNGSNDGSVEVIRAWTRRNANAKAVCLSENTGFCRGNNLGFAEARGDWIALLNTDAVADLHWLEELVRYGDPDRRVGMLASKILFCDPPGVIDKAGHLIYWDGQNRGRGTMEKDVGQYDHAEEILWPDACAALYHRRVFEETGGFDEIFFAYGDDADLGMRARLLGWKAWYVPTARVRHRHSATAGEYSPLKIMLVERNRLLLALKNFSIPLLLQNPYWTARRLAWNAYAALRGQGAAGRFVETNGWRRAVINLAWSYLSAAKHLPGTLRARRHIQRSKRLSDRQITELLRRYQIDLRELAMRG
jgi:GT2 family glycosyltransferase